MTEPTCTCRFYDDGDPENGPHLAVDYDPDCPTHGREAEPDKWADEWPEPPGSDPKVG